MFYSQNPSAQVAFSRLPLIFLNPADPREGSLPDPTRYPFRASSYHEIQKRHREKSYTLLKFLADGEKYTSMKVASWLLILGERQTRATLSGMTKENLVMPETLHSGMRIYGITRKGADFIYPTEVFGLFSAGKTSPLTVTHRLQSQLVRFQMQLFYDARDWASEKVLLKHRPLPFVPDGMCTIHDIITAIEVELHLKSLVEQRRIFNNYCQVLGDVGDVMAQVNLVIFFTPFVDQMVERINKFVPEQHRHRFYVMYLDPILAAHVPRSYRRNLELARFLRDFK